MTAIYLEKRDPTKNQFRFYRMEIHPNLFGEWTLQREWGRIGRKGQCRLDWFESRKQADQAIQEIGTVKQKRGYCRLPEQLFLF